MEEISQTELYGTGTYREDVLTAVRARARDRRRARALPHEEGKRRDAASDAARPPSWPRRPPTRTTTRSPPTRRPDAELARFPYKPYCRECGRDTVTLTSYDDETTDLAYTCESAASPASPTWPPRTRASWCGRSTGRCAGPLPRRLRGGRLRPRDPRLVLHRRPRARRDVLRLPRPAWFGYGFVGFAGVQKMSSSAGGVPTAADALRVLEAPILRWLYVRRAPKQTFTIDFGPEVVRLYDEWDALGRKAADPASATAPCWRGSARRDGVRRPAADLPRRRTVPDAVVGRRRHRRLRRADQPDHRSGRASPTTPWPTCSRDWAGRWPGPRSSSPPPSGPSCGRPRTPSGSPR